MSKSKHSASKNEAKSKIAQGNDEMLDPLDDLPSLAVMQAAAGAALKPRSVHYSRREATDLQVLDIDHSQWSADADSALNQLDWFSDRSCFEWAYEATRPEFKSLYEQDPETWDRLYKSKGMEMRDSRGFLTPSFTLWFREFCKFDPGSNARQYSAEMWARGDFHGDKDPSDKKPQGGNKGREQQTIILEWLISRILDKWSGRPDGTSSAAAIWQHIKRSIDQYSEESVDKFGYDLEWEDDPNKPDRNAGKLVFYREDGSEKKRFIQFESFKKKVSAFNKKMRTE
jgi:hypothetical protein